MYTVKDEVRVYQGRIATITKVIFEVVDGKETDNVYAYEAIIDGEEYTIFPEDIEQ